MVNIDPLPKVTSEDKSIDNSQQEVHVLTHATIKDNTNTSINVTISNIGRRLREMPLWIQVMVAVVLAMALFLAYRQFADSSQKIEKLVSVVERDVTSAGTDFMSASNVMLNVIPQNILQENNAEQWASISRLWMRSGQTINNVYSSASQCLKSKECAVGTSSKQICRHAFLLATSNLKSYKMLNSISGININESGSDSLLPPPDGVGEVKLPDITNLLYVAKECGTFGSEK